MCIAVGFLDKPRLTEDVDGTILPRCAKNKKKAVNLLTRDVQVVIYKQGRLTI
jgi:hypothetical protein